MLPCTRDLTFSWPDTNTIKCLHFSRNFKPRLFQYFRHILFRMDQKSSQKVNGPRPGLGVMLCLLVVIIGFLFFKSFLPGWTVFSNDGPLGVENSASHKVPDTFFGGWQDLNSIGVREGALPDITYCLLWFLGPLGFSKFYAPVAIFILGMGAWTSFRRLGFAPVVCVLGAVAAALNSTFFSSA